MKDPKQRKTARSLGIIVVLAFGIVLLLSAFALAASPQDIYNDFADNGRLDGTYTQAELNAVLTDPVLAQYGDQSTLDRLKQLIRSQPSAPRSSFPFTGAQIALGLVGGVALVGVGVFLRRGQRRA